MRKFRIPLIGAGVLSVLAVVLFAQMNLPKPQSNFTQGHAAPDFTLKDQDGKDFHLADLRGSKALLIFYRGYW